MGDSTAFADPRKLGGGVLEGAPEAIAISRDATPGVPDALVATVHGQLAHLTG